jgi:hypothetical protein
MGQIGCPETSVINYKHCLLNNPEERSGQVLHILSVFVALGIQHAMRMRHICHLWSAPLYSIFPRYLLKGTIFLKKSY